MQTVAIIDYGMCNLDSVARAVEECGGKPMVTAKRKDIEAADRVVLPGVGAFGDGIAHLKERELPEVLRTVVDAGVPLLGICLGMQFLATRGEEGGEHEGLGFIDGTVVKLQPTGDERIPHIGWDEVHFEREGKPLPPSPLFAGIDSGKDFYFVHSYHFVAEHKKDIVGWTPYGDGCVSAVARQNVYGVQFHPEKSQKLGFAVLRNFLSL